MKVVRLALAGILALCLLGIIPQPSQAQDAAPDSGFFVFKSEAGWWACDQAPCTYDAPEVSGRMVSGDFNGDGLAEIAAWNFNGVGSEINVWQSTRTSFSDRTPWMTCSYPCGLNALAEGGLVAGDFDGDGKDDIAALYDYRDGDAELDVWLSAGSEFYGGESDPWWHCGPKCYAASAVARRVVAGDFNGDGKDDIAAMYDYGNSHSALHVWISDGSAFKYQGDNGWWWCGDGCYQASAVTGRFVAGDFDDDGKADIAAMYGYGALHVWLSTGSAFKYQGNDGWWRDGNYDAWKVTDRFVSGDFDLNGKADIAAMRDYGDGNSRLHVWLSTGSAFDYQRDQGWWRSAENTYPASAVTGRLVAGDIDGDGRADITGLRDYGNDHARLHVWIAARWAPPPQQTYLPLIMKR